MRTIKEKVMYAIECYNLKSDSWVVCQDLNYAEEEVACIYFARSVAKSNLKEWAETDITHQYRITNVKVVPV